MLFDYKNFREIVKYYIYMGSNRPKVLGKGVLISNGEVGNHKM
ncbi:MAG: hypothetical protein RHS_0719 [Robinsoniella sp. RHS]|nr:MAG: hypothetical protein RHS_0719 [Robinsoniella sp. RHS]